MLSPGTLKRSWDFMKLSKRLSAIFDHIITWMSVLAGILLAFSVISVSISVATRYFFNYPVGWVTEICAYILLYITFMVAAWVLKEEAHVTIDIILEQLKPRVQSFINIITSYISAIVCLILTFFGARETWELYKTGYFTPTELELPKWIINIIIFVGSLLLFIQFLRRGHGYMGIWRHPKNKKQMTSTIHEFEA
jgi:C4-dicarboxylate transporter DctQ subunit